MKIDVVYVTYNANIKLLQKSIDSISSQVRKIYVIDNTPMGDKNLLKLKSKNIKLIFLKENYGIAHAQNIGIKKTIADKSDYMMLSDQDTCYPDNYIDNMIKTFDSADNIAAIAPKFIDNVKKGEDGFIKETVFGFKHFFPKEGLHEIMQAIASGKILNVKYLGQIGLMDEKLFIDWVDLEWCWRARAKGFKIIGNANVVIKHQLGDESVNIGFREVNLRSPLRHYYITRNAFHLAVRDESLDAFHKIILFAKSFRYIIGFPLLSKPHTKHLKYVLTGFVHGITGKLGKYNG